MLGPTSANLFELLYLRVVPHRTRSDNPTRENLCKSSIAIRMLFVIFFQETIEITISPTYAVSGVIWFSCLFTYK